MNTTDNNKFSQLTINSKVNFYVERFNNHANKSAENVLEMCRVMYEAKKNMEKDDFGEFCIAINVQKSSSCISKMYAIGERYDFLKKHAHLLPSAWTTLYNLSKLTDDQFINAIDEKIINVNMTAKALSNFIPNKQTKKTENHMQYPNDAIKRFEISNLLELEEDIKNDLLKNISDICKQYSCELISIGE